MSATYTTSRIPSGLSALALLLLVASLATAEGRFLCAGTIGSPAHSQLHPEAAKPTSEPRQGHQSAIVIFAGFQGEAAGRSVPAWSDRILDPDLPGSFSHFYHTMSLGHLTVDGAIASRWYQSEQVSDAYLAADQTSFGGYGQFSAEILRQVDEDIDFSRFDNDGPDGIPDSGDDDRHVDALFLVLPTAPARFIRGPATGVASLGLDQAYRTNDVGVEGFPVHIRPWTGCVLQGESYTETVGAMCHEYGHVLGLPDLYDTDFLLQPDADPAHDSAGIGRWGLMGWGALGWNDDDGPNPLCAWSRLRLGWAEAHTPTQPREQIRVPALGAGHTLGRIRFPNGEYYLLEYRQHETGYYDRHIPADGLLIWHVRPDAHETQLDLVCADGRWADAGYPLGLDADPVHGGDNLDFWAHDPVYTEQHAGNHGDATDVFDGVHYGALTPESNPSSCSDAGNCSARVEDIRLEEGSALATVSVPPMVEFEKIWVDGAVGYEVLPCGGLGELHFEISVDPRQHRRLRVWLSEQDPWIAASGHAVLGPGRLRDGRLIHQTYSGVAPVIQTECGFVGTHTASAWLMVEEEVGAGWEMLWRHPFQVEVVDPFPTESDVEVVDSGGDGVPQAGEFIRLLVHATEAMRPTRGDLRSPDPRVRLTTSSALSYHGPEGPELVPSVTPEFLLSSALGPGQVLVFALTLGTRSDTLRIPVGEGTDRTPPRVLGLQHHPAAGGWSLRMPMGRLIDGSEISAVSATVYAAADSSPVGSVELARDARGYEGIWAGEVDEQYLVQAVATDASGNIGKGPLQMVAPAWTSEPAAVQFMSGRIEGTGAVSSLAYSADGSLLAVARGRTVKLYGALRQLVVGELPGARAHVEDIAFHPHEQLLAVAHENGTVELWDVMGLQQEQLATGGPAVTALAFSPNGNELAGGTRDGVVRVWGMASREEVGRITAIDGMTISSVAFGRLGRRLAVGALGGGALQWQVRSQDAPAALSAYGEEVEALVYNPPGSILTVAGRDGSVRLWDAARGSLVADLQGHADWVTSLAVRPNGRVLASGGWDGTVRLWLLPQHVSSGVLQTRIGSAVQSLAFSPDGLTLAAGMSSGEVILWRVPSLVPTWGEGAVHPVVSVHAPYPNPFNSGVWIPFSLAWDAPVRVRIYGVTGQLLRALEPVSRSAGNYWRPEDAVLWDGCDQEGAHVASGVYFCTVEMHGTRVTQKVVLLR